METKELKITVPDGYEVDKDNSTFECIKFKPKYLTYDDVASALFCDSTTCVFYTDTYGEIHDCMYIGNSRTNPNNAKSKEQLEKLFAINKLMNVSKFLNKGWKPDWEDEMDHKFFFGIEENEIYINETNTNNESFCYFKCPELAQRAVSILGDDTIRLALSTDW